MTELSRRDFCALVCGAAIAGCTSSGPSAIQTGGLTGDDDGTGSTPDAPGSTDAGGGGTGGGGAGGGGGGSADAATCPASGATDVGDPTTFTSTPTYVSAQKLFVARDSGGLYAMTAVCPHQGATTEVESSEIYCPRHGATFTFTGTVTGGPTSKSLTHYAMCTLANGHVGVIKSQTVDASERLDA